ncbi:uncharacterized protein BXZ73DRAFT_86744 [Epithele typhae]|uniref:uncharacterized protein n=1 Tax=Epithele typhae TaxID=378194 RepID=UPI0020073FCB|nr:uncharacterized protein BXZ73DRAFT_86744 [Epithele typhae]KAH9945213.1 hypothetical protein BXZ73DRAFT_86744 [Epithele typhae]
MAKATTKSEKAAKLSKKPSKPDLKDEAKVKPAKPSKAAADPSASKSKKELKSKSAAKDVEAQPEPEHDKPAVSPKKKASKKGESAREKEAEPSRSEVGVEGKTVSGTKSPGAAIGENAKEKRKRKASVVEAVPVNSKKTRKDKDVEPVEESTDEPMKPTKKSKSSVPAVKSSTPSPSKESKKTRTKGQKSEPEPAEVEAEEDVQAEDEDEQQVFGFSSDDDDSSDEEVADDIPGIDIGKLPTIAKDDETVKRKLEKAKRKRNQDVGVIYLGRIPHGFYEDQMRAYFLQFGDITRLRVSRNKKTGKPKHYAFIEFDSSSVAQIVAETMDNYLLMGHILTCKVIPKDQVHPELWVGANRKWRAVPRSRVARVEQNRPRTEQEIAQAEKRLLKRQDQRKRKLEEAGIDYDFSAVAYVSSP